MYEWISLQSSADIGKLVGVITPEYNPEDVAKKLAAGISDAVKAVLVESDYVDKDYRSTYYQFYAKKGMKYRADCMRLHFFDGTVSFDKDSYTLKTASGDDLSHHYFGYMVLRPTGIATIGRSVVSPDVRRGATGQVISAKHKVHLLGYKLHVEGFPSMQQHVDISVCAHVACWSILRHYSERYSVHGEHLTHDVTLMAQQFNPGGLVPSKGLEVSHAERVFQEAGTFPIHVAKAGADDPAFYRQLLAYVESGFPLFAAMHRRAHAIAVAGYEWDAAGAKTPASLWDKVKSALGSTPSPSLQYAWEKVKSLVAVDDNHLPYLRIPATAPDPSVGPTYTARDIDAFIVALPEKIYYPADAVDKFAPMLLRIPLLELPPADQTVIRYFITTGAALRHFVRNHISAFDPKLVESIMTLPFPQFLWIVEYATEDQWAVGQITGRVVIDATASLREYLPLWLVHSRKMALLFDRQSVNPDQSATAKWLPLSGMEATAQVRMEQNLRPIQAK
ncbi:MAG: hypothetical protein EG825_05860 [Rhodocyclaceae bacterium]|nr:hypothetical protein [Rhodocyclaceae bacterium]